MGKILIYISDSKGFIAKFFFILEQCRWSYWMA